MAFSVLLFATKVAAAPSNEKFSPYDPKEVFYKPNPPSELAPVQVRVAPKTTYCSCVTYAKSLTGFSTVIGYARRWPVNSSTPQVGSIVVTNEGPYGHVAFIRGITEDGFLVLDEANYRRCQRTTGRRLSITSPFIKGYWIP